MAPEVWTVEPAAPLALSWGSMLSSGASSTMPSGSKHAAGVLELHRGCVGGRCSGLSLHGLLSTGLLGGCSGGAKISVRQPDWPSSHHQVLKTNASSSSPPPSSVLILALLLLPLLLPQSQQFCCNGA